jgi:hypothetical protein
MVSVKRTQPETAYKFALWRALASLAPGTDERSSKISKRELSSLFLGYYWPLEVKYHIRQGIDPDRDPVVMVRIRKLVRDGKIIQGESLRDFQRRMPAEHKSLLDKVAQDAFDDVVPRFHTVRAEPIAQQSLLLREKLETLATPLS